MDVLAVLLYHSQSSAEAVVSRLFGLQQRCRRHQEEGAQEANRNGEGRSQLCRLGVELQWFVSEGESIDVRFWFGESPSSRRDVDSDSRLAVVKTRAELQVRLLTKITPASLPRLLPAKLGPTYATSAKSHCHPGSGLGLSLAPCFSWIWVFPVVNTTSEAGRPRKWTFIHPVLVEYGVLWRLQVLHSMETTPNVLL